MGSNLSQPELDGVRGPCLRWRELWLHEAEKSRDKTVGSELAFKPLTQPRSEYLWHMVVRMPRNNNIVIPEKPRKPCKQLFREPSYGQNDLCPWWSGPQGTKTQLFQGWTNVVPPFRGGPLHTSFSEARLKNVYIYIYTHIYRYAPPHQTPPPTRRKCEHGRWSARLTELGEGKAKPPAPRCEGELDPSRCVFFAPPVSC